MKKYKFLKILLIASTLGYFQSSYAQIKVSGVVLDSLTHLPISDLSILDVKNNKGTITNENGEFEISVSGLPVNILFSHISYKKITKVVDYESLGQIYLPLSIINLPEFQTENPSLALLNSAINKALSDTINRYPCRAFYQKISKEGSNVTNVNEIYFDGLLGQLGIVKWLPTHARYASKENSSFKFQNFTSSVFYNSGVASKNIDKPYSYRNDKDIFNFKIGKYINFDTDNEIVEIICTPKLKENFYFEGSIYIKTKNSNIVKIVGEMHYPNPNLKRLKNPYDSYTINFREGKNGFSILDNLTFTKTVTFSGISEKKIIESSKLIIYDYNDSINTQNMVSAFVNSDLDLIKNIPYNSQFWENNIVIKRSNLEKSLIKSFENSRSFESNFINKK
jgi:hypothetical protein